MRNQQIGWTRQKVFHLMIGSSNTGCFIYFISALAATCKGWLCWLHVCGFILMAYPKILFLATFLLLLSFWIDLCHQANGEEDDDGENSTQQPLLENSKSKPDSSNVDSRRKCCSLQAIHVGNRQKIVILVIVLVFMLMIVSAVLIWIGLEKNPIDSLLVARAYEVLFSIMIFLLGGALGFYGLLLLFKMSKVRSEKASSEKWKVAGLAVVSVVCFTSSALVALLTDIPLFYHRHPKKINGGKTPLLLFLYYFLDSAVPSAFVLWVMRELPAPVAVDRRKVRTFFIYGGAATRHPHRSTASSSKNQASSASPI